MNSKISWKNRVLSLFLMLAMCFTMFPLSNSPVYGYTESGEMANGQIGSYTITEVRR